MACSAAVALYTSDCDAQQSAVALEWDAPTKCPQSQDVLDQLRVILGDLADTAQTNPLRARGTIEAGDDRYRLTLEIERNATRGTRVIESSDCKSLGKAAALVMGLVIRREKDLGRELLPSELSGFAEQPPPQASAAPPPVKKSEPVPIPATAVRVERQPWLMLVLPTASLDVGTLPMPGYGLGAGVGVSSSGWRSWVSGALWAKQTATTASALEPFQTEYSRRSLQANVCRDFSAGTFAIGPCVVFAFDSVKASAATAVTNDRGSRLISASPTATWFSTGAGISGAWRLSHHLSVVGSAMLRVALTRPSFAVRAAVDDGSPEHRLLTYETQAHQVPFGAFDSSLGLVWIF